MKLMFKFQTADLTWKPEFYIYNNEWQCIPRTRYHQIFNDLKYGKYSALNQKELDNAERNSARKISHWEKVAETK